MSAHIPVLLKEVLHFLNPQSDGRFIDATLGAGGHSSAILARTSPAGRLLGIDQDEAAVEIAMRGLQSFGSRVVIAAGNFRDVETIAAQHGFVPCEGVLADIGVSSMMLQDASRGFSFMLEGPLDMRMNQQQELQAKDVVNDFTEKEIADILYTYGEERRSRAIARSIVRFRPLTSTMDLTAAVQRVLGPPGHGRIHPATRTFQALRIYVNDELSALESFIAGSMTVIRSGGRLVIITFHSLEDRIVKNRFRSPHVPGRVLTKKVVVADEEELKANPRARSAKLRAWEKI
jgi:16S rRNA (cytosine1402-N4)-methyltransferase